MTTTVFLVRHGSHDRLNRILCGRMPGVGLSEDGRAEARRVADRLARENLDEVYASPLERAAETAEPIAETLGRPAVTVDALNELNFGDWTGKPFEALHGDPLWDRWNQARGHARPPQGESMGEVQLRVAEFLSLVVARHPDGRVAAVSHGDVIKAAICHAIGLPVDFHHRFEVSPASISVLVAGDWGLKVHSVNEVAP